MNLPTLVTQLILATSIITFQQFSFAEINSISDEHSDQVSQKVITQAFSLSSIQLTNHFDIYSETTSRLNNNSVVHQSRFRWLIGSERPWAENLSLYLGFGVDRELGQPEQQWIQDSWRPHAGIQWRPLEFLQTWVEYNDRYFAEKNGDSANQQQSDPRVGISLGKSIDFESSNNQEVKIENYFEGISYLRKNNQPVLSGYSRPIYQLDISKTYSAAAYSELYFQRSPDSDLGTNTNQIRPGLRIQGKWSHVSASLCSYWPKELTESKSYDGQLVNLFVLGGYF